MFEFSWRAALLTLVCLAFGWYVYGQSERPGFILAIGTVNATDQERDECYFGVGVNAVRAAVVSFHPKNEACIRARELVGQAGRLVFIPDAR